MSGRGCAGLAVVAVCGATAFLALPFVAPAGGRAPAPIRPVPGDWEGRGPLGLRLSFALVRRGHSTSVADFALGLPTGCRSTGGQTWDAGTVPRIEYLGPGTKLHGPFRPLGPRQFEFTIPPHAGQSFPVTMEGTFSNPRRGEVSIRSPTTAICSHTGWPRTLHFALAAEQRVPVADGDWSGTITAPKGMTGTVQVHVIDGGRIETDFATSFTCPSSGSGKFEIGPLETVGYLIEANGVIGGTRGTENAWRGRFSARGVLNGSFAASGCGSPVPEATFTVRPNLRSGAGSPARAGR